MLRVSGETYSIKHGFNGYAFSVDTNLVTVSDTSFTAGQQITFRCVAGKSEAVPVLLVNTDNNYETVAIHV